MKKLLKSRAGIAVLTCVVTAGVVSATFAVAANSPSGNTFYACARNGQIDQDSIQVNTPPKCDKHETVVSWNQTGPVGGTGTPGTPGGTGLAGPPGGVGGTGLQGGTGPAGPANVNALQGTPCTSDGIAGTVNVTTDPSTNAITLTCDRPSVTVTVTNGTLTSDILDDTNHAYNGGCGTPGAAFCADSIPNGDQVRIALDSGVPFHYTCPGGTPTAATLLVPGDYEALCGTTSLSGNYDITATIDSP